MNAPQIILISLYAVSLLASAYLHGKPKEGKHNFFISLVSACVVVALLMWGGFFK